MDTYRACVISLDDTVMVGVMVAVIFADFCHVLLTTRVGGNAPISLGRLRSRAPVLGGDG